MKRYDYLILGSNSFRSYYNYLLNKNKSVLGVIDKGTVVFLYFYQINIKKYKFIKLI